jgi:hypothetical protein
MRLLVAWKMKEENPTVGKLLAACEKVNVEGAAKRALKAPHLN